MKLNLFRTLLGAAALLSSTAFAHAAGPFVAGSHWTGFRVSTVGGGSSSAVLDVGNNPNAGMLKVLGQNVPVSIACTASGVVDFQGLGIPYAGFRVHGAVAPQGGTYSLTGNYFITNVPGMHNDTGRISLLRSYKTVTGGPLLIGNTAGVGLFPPGPCTGLFVNAAGFQGRMVLEHNPPGDVPGELDPPSDFVGNVSFFTGDGSNTFAVVGTINPEANADGSHEIDLLGENRNLTSLYSSLTTTGLLLPAVRTNPVSIAGNYELIGLLRNTTPISTTGRFQIGQ